MKYTLRSLEGTKIAEIKMYVGNQLMNNTDHNAVGPLQCGKFMRLAREFEGCCSQITLYGGRPPQTNCFRALTGKPCPHSVSNSRVCIHRKGKQSEDNSDSEPSEGP